MESLILDCREITREVNEYGRCRDKAAFIRGVILTDESVIEAMTIRWEWVIEHFPNTSVASFDDFTLKIWQKWYENVSKRMERTASIRQGSLRPEVRESIYPLLRLLMLKVSKEISEPFRQQVTGRGFKEMNLTNASPTPNPESTLFRAPTRTPISESTLFRTPTRTISLFPTSPASCNPFVNSRGTVTRIIRHTRHISESTPTNHVPVVGSDSPSPSPLKSRSAVRPLGINLSNVVVHKRKNREEISDPSHSPMDIVSPPRKRQRTEITSSQSAVKKSILDHTEALIRMKVLRPKDLIDLVLRLQEEICDDSDTSIVQLSLDERNRTADEIENAVTVHDTMDNVEMQPVEKFHHSEPEIIGTLRNTSSDVIIGGDLSSSAPEDKRANSVSIPEDVEMTDVTDAGVNKIIANENSEFDPNLSLKSSNPQSQAGTLRPRFK